MTTSLTDAPDGSQSPTTPSARATRPFYWSLRRELWENRSLVIAPLIVAGVQLFGFAVFVHRLPGMRRAALLLAPAEQRAAIERPYDIAAMMMILTVFIVGVFYCLDALYGERRDRSVMFWKSLPVSDLTTVLAKACIPLVVLPLIAFVITIGVQLVMLAVSTLVLLMNGMPPATSAQLPLAFSWAVLLYGLVALSLWHAPVYAWLLLVSSWVRRAAFLWAVLPWFAIGVFERVTFGSGYLSSFLRYRLFNFADQAFAFSRYGEHDMPTIESFAQLTPGRFLTSAGLWLGLVFAVICIVAAVRSRRYRGPV